jgi:hypothetical protein
VFVIAFNRDRIFVRCPALSHPEVMLLATEPEIFDREYSMACEDESARIVSVEKLPIAPTVSVIAPVDFSKEPIFSHYPHPSSRQANHIPRNTRLHGHRNDPRHEKRPIDLRDAS